MNLPYSIICRIATLRPVFITNASAILGADEPDWAGMDAAIQRACDEDPEIEARLREMAQQWQKERAEAEAAP